MSIIDEETRQIILRKTWCHGQAILPPYSIVLLLWWWHSLEQPRPFTVVFAALVLPIWAWYSYHAVLIVDQNNGTLPYRNICGFGVVAMLAHLLTFRVAIQSWADSTTGHMLLAIFSGLAFVETGAFLLVVTALRREVVDADEQSHAMRMNHRGGDFIAVDNVVNTNQNQMQTLV